MNLSLKQYRTIDLVIMLMLLVVSEALIGAAARSWFPDELYVLSPTIAIVCIVMMRWGGYAALHALGGGLTLCAVSGAGLRQTAVYCIGNCFALAAMFFFKAFGKEKVRTKTSLSLLFTASAFFAAQAGRTAAGIVFGGSAGDIVRFILTDSLSLVFAVVTVQLTRRLDGIFEDQVSYLIRTHSERRKSQMLDQADSGYGDI